MLTISNEMGAGAALKYYKSNANNATKEYYAEAKLGGKAADFLGLGKKQADEHSFKNLLDGFDPTTGKKLANNAGAEDRRAGIDLTFSAPKSVSLLNAALKLQKNTEESAKIEDAHTRAVNAVMQEIEENYAETRVMNKETNKREKQNADGIIYAQIQHLETRPSKETEEVDPQLHTHNFLFNYALKDGKIRALEKPNVLKNQKYLGQLYRNNLAKNLIELGYKINVTSFENGFFELEGISEKQIETFSNRTKEIEKEVAENIEKLRETLPNAREAELKDIIKSKTKLKKVAIDDNIKEKDWQKRLEEVGFFKAGFMENLKELDKFDYMYSKNYTKKTNEIIKEAGEIITDKKSVFSKEELIDIALKLSLERGNTSDDFTDLFAENAEFVKLDENVYTTQNMEKTEIENIQICHDTRGEFKPIVENLDFYKEEKTEYETEKGFKITSDQNAMLEAILTTEDQFVAINGLAGTGKTTAAELLKNYIQKYTNMEIVGASFMGKAAGGLEKESGIKSKTLDAYFAAEEKGEFRLKPRLLLVDEAGLTGSKQINRIMQIAKKHGDKVVFMGDTNQFGSIAAGNSFADLQKFGKIKTVKMEESNRQKTAYTKKAVQAVLNKDIGKALKELEDKGNLFEYLKVDQKEILLADYAKQTKDYKKNSVILVSSNVERNEYNTALREVYFAKEEKKEEFTFDTMERINLDNLKKYDLNSIVKHNMHISLNGGAPSGIKAGITYKIENFDEKTSTATIKKTSGEEIKINLKNNDFSLFKTTEKEFQGGDKIIFTKNTNDKKTGFTVKNGDTDTIKKIDEKGEVETESGLKFNIKKHNFIDYAYALTDVKSQGISVNNVYVVANSDKVDLKRFYVQTSRVKQDLKVFTNNKEKLIENALKINDNKSTLDYKTKEDIEYATRPSFDTDRGRQKSIQKPVNSGFGNAQPTHNRNRLRGLPFRNLAEPSTRAGMLLRRDTQHILDAGGRLRRSDFKMRRASYSIGENESRGSIKTNGTNRETFNENERARNGANANTKQASNDRKTERKNKRRTRTKHANINKNIGGIDRENIKDIKAKYNSFLKKTEQKQRAEELRRVEEERKKQNASINQSFRKR